MKREDSMVFCRYYKGEEEPPNGYSAVRKTIWKFEAMWVDLAEKEDEFLADCVIDYVAHGLGSFENMDGVPVSLKAFLLNRYFKHEEREDVPSFKRFYKEHYTNRKGA